MACCLIGTKPLAQYLNQTNADLVILLLSWSGIMCFLNCAANEDMFKLNLKYPAIWLICLLRCIKFELNWNWKKMNWIGIELKDSESNLNWNWIELKNPESSLNWNWIELKEMNWSEPCPYQQRPPTTPAPSCMYRQFHGCAANNKANLRDLIAATGLVILFKLDSNHRFFSPCDLEIWRMTLKNNRAPLLCYFKLCASFQCHRLIQTGVTVRKRLIWVKIDDFFSRVTLKFDVWPWKTRQHSTQSVGNMPPPSPRHLLPHFSR